MMFEQATAAAPSSSLRTNGLPRLQLANGSLEALKWLALLLMLGDHVNKYLLHDAVPVLFDAGRLVMPIFAVVLGYNLGRGSTKGYTEELEDGCHAGYLRPFFS
jgi:hypothetical protein